jgi:pilus assembly protein CpaB
MQTVQVRKPPRQPKKPPLDLRKLVSTRRGSALVAGATALLAAGVIMVFLNQYRHAVNSGNEGVTVLVARSLIPKGSSGTILAEKSIFQTARVRKRDLKNGAIADPANLRGRVAVSDIYPGQQLIVGDFAPSTGGVREQLVGNQRAISLPLDDSHGMIGDVQAGDHVDVFFGSGTTAVGPGSQNRQFLMTLIRNLLVLQAPKAAKSGAAVGGSTQTQEVVLRATDAQAAQLAFASDTGKIWLVLRPKVDATNSKASLVNERVLVFDAAAAASAAGSGR